MSYTIHCGDNRDILPTLDTASIDSIVTDPPYELGFMGKKWDASGIAYDQQLWAECLRVLKPGGHLISFGGSRTYHRMACAIEDAGFEVRDQLLWVYGSGFPKGHDIAKAIDRAAGVEPVPVTEQVSDLFGEREVPLIDRRLNSPSGLVNIGQGEPTPVERVLGEPVTDEAKQWQGWNTALKPAHEPMVLARKPLDGTVIDNVLTHGVGGLNIDGCRVGEEQRVNPPAGTGPRVAMGDGWRDDAAARVAVGRWPANLIHDGSVEVERRLNGAASFFYCAKTSHGDRNDGLDGFVERSPNPARVTASWGMYPKAMYPARRNFHPTVKPTELMAHLVRLITPVGGVVLDPFTGSGSTGKAAAMEGMSFVGIELDPEYVAIATARIEHALRRPTCHAQ